MGNGKKMNRRGLFALFGVGDARPDPPKGFSLDAFYRRRERDGATESLPKFTLREGLPDARQWSTKVGVSELSNEKAGDDDTE